MVVGGWGAADEFWKEEAKRISRDAHNIQARSMVVDPKD